MSCGSFILSTCTCLALLCGLGLVAVGGFVLANMYTYYEFVDPTLVYGVSGMMALGFIVALISFFGCYGACTKSRKMLTTFIVLKALVFAVEIALVVLALIYKDEVRDFTSKVMKDGLKNYGQPGHETSTALFDSIQHEFQCCGVEDWRDWQNVTWSNKSNVPMSCCLIRSEGCGENALAAPSNTGHIFEDGCFVFMVGMVNSNAIYIIGIFVLLIIIQLLSSLLGCVVCAKAKENYYV